jgi:hypothetical protein
MRTDLLRILTTSGDFFHDPGGEAVAPEGVVGDEMEAEANSDLSFSDPVVLW